MTHKEQTFISAVIYVHNAEKRIGKFLETILSVLESNFEHSEIICVNDYSDDNSVQIIRQVSTLAASTSITVLNMSYFHGLEASMNAGTDLSIGDFVLEFDNTFLDFESEQIIAIYQRALQGYDIVSASPAKKEKLTSRLFYWVFDRFTDTSYRLSTESFRILSRRVINRISSMNKTIPYRKAVYADCGLKTDNIRYEILRDKTDKPEKIDKKERHYRSGLAVDSLILFTEVGYTFAKAMTMLMMLMAVFILIYSVVIYISYHPVEGWTTTILFMSVAFFGLFGILTIIIKYLQLLVDLVFRRKHYSFQSIEKLTENEEISYNVK